MCIRDRAHAEQLAFEGKKEEEFALLKSMDDLLAADDYAGLKTLIEDHKISCSVSKTCNWTDVRLFNLMFKTEFGAVTSDNPEDNIVYLRPETAQGIFVNFLNVQKTGRMKIPFGIAPVSYTHLDVYKRQPSSQSTSKYFT